MIAADMDLFSLHELTDVIREAAMTHREYLHNEDIYEALMDVARNIETAQKRFWQPEASDVIAADDYKEENKPASQLIAEAKAEMAPTEWFKAPIAGLEPQYQPESLRFVS